MMRMAAACALAVATGGCGDRDAELDQCVDPKLLRAKVADTVFDLPSTVDHPHSIYMDETRTDGRLGIVGLGYRAHSANPAYRWNCNRKDHPVADFRTEMGFVYRGDGTEPADYRAGDRMYSLAAIGAYDPRSAVQWRATYLAEVPDIEKVRFVARRLALSGKDATYEFRFGDRRLKIACQIHDDAKLGRANPRPAFPLLCDKMPFRAGDIVIAVSHQSWQGDAKAGYRLIPPEQWPRQWAFVIGKILDFRVAGPSSEDNR